MSSCIGLDVRIFGALERVGVRVSPDGIYKQIERELREKVAEPRGLSGEDSTAYSFRMLVTRWFAHFTCNLELLFSP
jgi:hypothetical protein